VKALVFAYNEMGCLGLESLLECGFEVSAVVTHPDSPGEEIWFRSVEKIAVSNGIPVHLVEQGVSDELAARLSALNPDYIFSFYFRKMLPLSVLNMARLGGLNLHGSLLPKYRGRSPINWVLVNGEIETGVTLHYMDEKPDHGDIVAQRSIAIDPTDTALTLYRKMDQVARDMLLAVLPRLKAGTAPRMAQDHKRSSYFGGRKPEDGKIDWAWPAAKVDCLVRAVSPPWPGAFARCRGRKLLVWSGQPVSQANAAPGTLVPHAQTLAVATAEGAYLPKQVRWEGREPMSWEQFIQDAELKSGATLDAD
jgi:methionyl-tRNA formyltransferase